MGSPKALTTRPSQSGVRVDFPGATGGVGPAPHADTLQGPERHEQRLSRPEPHDFAWQILASDAATAVKPAVVADGQASLQAFHFHKEARDPADPAEETKIGEPIQFADNVSSTFDHVFLPFIHTTNNEPTDAGTLARAALRFGKAGGRLRDCAQFSFRFRPIWPNTTRYDCI